MALSPRLSHPITMVGAGLATIGAVLVLTVFALDLFGFHTNPYIGILVFLVLPAIFLFGLALMPLGFWLNRRRERAGRGPAHWPSIDLNNPSTRRAVLGIAVLTFVNVVIVSLAAYRGVEYMDSVGFCGQVCHEVMEPEFAAYQDGPHSRVTCVQCHIGSGASWFVKSKLSGARQVVAVLANSHSRPIPSPVSDLRPARDTCEQCHWPEKFHGDKVDVRREYASDEANSETVMTLRVHVGGGSERLGIATGIHWHMNVANRIEYVATDDKRQTIPWVRLTDRQGRIREFRAPDVSDDAIARGERRLMDCMDCHNRPSHPFDPSPERAVDTAIALGDISRELPFIRREAVAALIERYDTREAAEARIAERLRGFYAKNYPSVASSRSAALERAVGRTQALYRRNVFPRMNVGWGTYMNNIGHNSGPGCFRCHDDSHKSPDGAVIRQDCDLCHTIE
ncbi:MAG TPA: NapC/NirT family cytochrome c [Vicinamibacterales bacterium]|jgi:hypothetical protein|nr:NapC/NirT family cytochrome c [Vicinamibacterales bacterium]